MAQRAVALGQYKHANSFFVYVLIRKSFSFSIVFCRFIIMCRFLLLM
ncbi:hypothetical protein HMPREF9445_01374 [Bacteroides clarus YIT 12056]|uniref:Uncharacterized protein n=1 Tax=Bacteroides clarus YIT 12056 TaxID=762984 RepID=A0ABN0CQ19_9BACE|nr:hypothetical protein HMPREF9445_01374 [Bacteroides clarus YIT 12056]